MEEEKKKKLTFEEKEKRVDEIISELEKNDKLTLKETSLLYQEAKNLLSDLDKELETAKNSVTDEKVSN